MLTVEKIADRIIKNSVGEAREGSNDTLKCGSESMSVSKVAVCFVASVEVVRKAIACGAEMIVTHEPTWYNASDEFYEWMEADSVQREKRQLIEDSGLAVWRFHDYMHAIRPDLIDVGMVKEMGWIDFRIEGSYKRFRIPEQTVADVANALKVALNATCPRLVGDPDLVVSHVAFCAGAPASRSQIQALRDESVELLVGGESREWETVEYVRDAVALGQRKAYLILGHSASEEGGMKHAASWLRRILPEVQVEYIESGDPFVAI